MGSLAAVLVATGMLTTELAAQVVVGVSTPAYYSWAATLLRGTGAQVVPLLPVGADLHFHQARPGDVELLQRVDLLVRDGLGHDAFLDPLLEAAGRADMEVVDLHAGVPLIPYSAGDPATAPVNAHTFLSLSTASQQIQNLASALVRRLPEQTRLIRGNARDYSRELRKLRVRTAGRLSSLQALRVATIHDGYGYLLQELGVEVVRVIQPRHGVEPSAKELADAIEDLRSAEVGVVVVERDLPSRYVEVLRAETGVRVVELAHLSGGEFTEGRFMEEMEASCKALLEALGTSP